MCQVCLIELLTYFDILVQEKKFQVFLENYEASDSGFLEDFGYIFLSLLIIVNE